MGLCPLSAARVIIGGFLLHLVLGTLYMWGNVSIYVTSYLRIYDTSVTSSNSLSIFSSSLLCQALFMPVGGIIEKSQGPRRCAYLAVVCVAAGMFISSYCQSVLSLCFAQALYGAGIGIGYIAPLSAGFKYLPARKGLVSGIIVAGFGAGSFVFNMVATQWVNPDNEKVPDGEDYYPADGDVAGGIPGMYRLLAICYLLLGFLGSSLLSNPEEEVALPLAHRKTEKKDENLPLIPQEEASVQDLQTREMMKTVNFFILISAFFCCGTGGMYLAATYKNFADVDEHLKSQGDHFFTYVGSFGSVCNGLSRVFWGILSDKIGPFNTLCVMSFLFPIIFFVYNLTVDNPYMYAGCVCLLFWCYGGNFALFPTITAKLFGIKNNGTNYGMVFIWFGAVTAFLIWGIGVEGDSLSFNTINWIVMMIGAVGCGLAITLKVKSKLD